jgi:uncharacterized protein (TIGR04255 family)
MARQLIKRELPDYEKPPVIEVVCGILFKHIPSLLYPHIGLLWNSYREEYSECREVAPLDPVIERFDELTQLSFEIGPLPPLPRIWLIHKDGTRLLQIQRDRFLHNWKKAKLEDEYPRYSRVKEMFFDQLAKFQVFLEGNNLGAIEPVQFEMTYINHIPLGDGWDRLGEVGKVFPDFSFRPTEGRFLPEPSGMMWRTVFDLPDKLGRLHAVIRNVKMKEKGLPVLLLDLTVRGIGEDRSSEGMKLWFDVAREWIVRGFEDLTREELQRVVWKKR